MGIQVDPNPSMQTKWTAVGLKIPRAIPYNPAFVMGAALVNRVATLKQLGQERQDLEDRARQAQEWCLTATHGRWSYQMGYLKDNGYCHIFRFKGPRDALLFKLAWGGA